MNAAVFHKSFSRLPLNTRLGNLAVTINRVADSLEQHQNSDGTKGFVREAMWFIEWTAAELEPEHMKVLIDTQRTMGQWSKNWDDVWSDQSTVIKVREQAREIAQQLFSWTN
jgi:hypothetical protein